MNVFSAFQRLLTDPSSFKYWKKFRKTNIVVSSHVEISDDSVLEDYVGIAHHAQILNSYIGKRTSVGRYAKIRDTNIGAYCSISWDVTIGAVTHPLDRLSTHAFTYRKQFGIVEQDTVIKQLQTNIGNDVWIGCGAIVKSGVTIGNGAIIGAGAVVTHDVAPYSIVVGVPAKHIKYRYSKELCDKAEKLKWWDWEDEKITEHLDLFLKPYEGEDEFLIN